MKLVRFCIYVTTKLNIIVYYKKGVSFKIFWQDNLYFLERSSQRFWHQNGNIYFVLVKYLIYALMLIIIVEMAEKPSMEQETNTTWNKDTSALSASSTKDTNRKRMERRVNGWMEWRSAARWVEDVAGFEQVRTHYSQVQLSCREKTAEPNSVRFRL